MEADWKWLMVGEGKVETDGKGVESGGRRWMAGGGKVNAGRSWEEASEKKADGRCLMVGRRRVEALVGKKTKRMCWWQMCYKTPQNKWLVQWLERRRQQKSVVWLVWLQTGLWLAGGDQ